MKAALSLVLAGLLVTTPVKLALAQAAEQEAAAVQQTAPPDSSGHRLIAVPPVTDNTSRLWEPLASEDALAGIFAYDDSKTRVAAPQELAGGAGASLVAVVLVSLLLVVIVVIVCASSDEGVGSLC